jgi:pilus assembly protein Flp/PilA
VPNIGAAPFRLGGSSASGNGVKGLRMSSIKRFWQDERGATALEYGLIAALLSVVVCAAVTLTGSKLYGVIGNVSNALK